ncbi:EthD domain-containing protein [Photobacterium sp. R1]
MDDGRDSRCMPDLIVILPAASLRIHILSAEESETMIKFVMCITRHPEMTREAFRDYWMNQHGPFFMKNADAMGAKRYVQSHLLETPLNEMLRDSRGMRPEYDGVAEVWFESIDALMAGMSSPEGQKLSAALLEDEKNFIDHDKSSAFIVEEHEF